MITIAKDQQSITRYEGAKSGNMELAAASIGADVAGKVTLLQAVTRRGKIDLHNVEVVRQITYQYMSQCSEAGAIPTVMGLAGALGVSRQWLNEYMRANASSATAKFLEVTKEFFADSLTQAALAKHISESVSIFILKNTASMSDKMEIEAVPASAAADEMDKEELFKRINGSVVLDEYDTESEDY